MIYYIDLKEDISISDYVNLVYALGSQLNDRKDRFDKSDIIEQSLETYSNGRLKYVDLIGVDHVDTKYNYNIEFKYVADGIFTKKKKPKKLIKVKLKNSLGKYKGTTIDKPADFYMIGQQDSIGIISWNKIKNFLVAVPDGIEAHIPFDSVDILFYPDEVLVNKNIDINYKKQKIEMQNKIIESVRLTNT